MASITLQLTGNCTAIIDDADADLAQSQWCAGDRYVMKSECIHGKRRSLYLHRVIMARKLGRELRPGEQVDHINLDRRDNRRSNLRLATAAQNCWNRPKSSANSTGFKGVSKERKRRKWRAAIRVHGVYRDLGRYDTPEEAHEAYKKAAAEHFGEFANFGDKP